MREHSAVRSNWTLVLALLLGLGLALALTTVAGVRDSMAASGEQAGDSDSASVDGLASTADWTATGENNSDRLGSQLASAGDVNGDGYADAIVAAYAYPSGALKGRVFVYHGSAGGLSSTPALTLTGQSDVDRFGRSVAGAGDVNGDGYADILIGAIGYPAGDHKGAVFVYHGSASGLAATPALTLTGENDVDYFGSSVAGAGDVNGDGFADAIIGAYGYPNAAQRGRAYVYHGSPSGLASAPARTLTGENDDDAFGGSVAGAGDVNGDGFADAIVGAQRYPNQDSKGRAYVYYGSPGGLPASPNRTLTGENDDDQFGVSVASAGDVNGDGYTDVIIGAEGHPGPDKWGAAYIYQGSSAGLAASPVLTLTGEGIRDHFGRSVSSAGDVNGDGYGDAIVGAYAYNGGDDKGRVYVHHGSASGLSATPSLSLTGETGDQFGIFVAGAGDVNGDGYADALVGADGYPGGTGNGRAYAYHGSGAGLSASPSLILTGQDNSDLLGGSVANAGDLNGDGFADVLVGAHGWPNGDARGAAFVHYGSAAGLTASPALTLTGENEKDRFGLPVASAGDVNGDGFADAIIGAGSYPSEGRRGRAYIYHGSASGLATTPALTLTGQSDSDNFGRAVASVGDVNGDGFADVVVGAYGHPDASYRGKAYVYHGSPAGLGAAPALTLTGENAGDQFGYSVASAGDVNGDSYADLIIGARNYPSGDGWGRAYVYHGSTTGLVASPALTLTGENDGDRFGTSVASTGDVNGDGFADVIVGADAYANGAAYVYEGSDSGLSASPTLVLTGANQLEGLGFAVAGAGDLNGDGFADAIVAAPFYGYTDLRGRAYIHHGSAAGLDATPAISFTGSTTDLLGISVASAGDVNGDGYADAIFGAYSYPNGDLQGRVYVHQGSDGGGRAVLARQKRSTGNTPVQPWGLSYDNNVFQVQMTATSPMGRQRVKLEVEACGPSLAFGAPGCQTYASTTWTDVTASSGGVVLALPIDGLDTNTLYRWRARVLYAAYTVDKPNITAPPNPAHGPWRRLNGQAGEADVRVLGSNLAVSKAVTPGAAAPGQTLTYTYRLTNTGGAPLDSVVAVDDKLGAVPLKSNSLAPGAWTSGTLTYTVIETDLPGPLVNTVVATGTPSSGADVTATDSASVVLEEVEAEGFRVYLPSVLRDWH